MVFDPYHTWLGIPPREQPPNYYRLLGIDVFEPNGDVICHAADRQMAHLRTFQTSKHSAESQRLLNEVAAARHCLLDSARRSAYDAELRVRMAERAAAAGTVGVPTPGAPAAFPSPSVTPSPPARYSTSSTGPFPTPYPSPYPIPLAVTNQSVPSYPPAVAPVAPEAAPASPAVAPTPTTVPVVRPVPVAVNPVPLPTSPALHTVRVRRRKNSTGEFFKIVLGGLVGCVAGFVILWYGFNIDPIGWREMVGADATPVAAEGVAGGANGLEASRASESGSPARPTYHPSSGGSAPAAGGQGKVEVGADIGAGPSSPGGKLGSLPTPGSVASAEPSTPNGSQRPLNSKSVVDPFEPAARNRPRVAVPDAAAQAATLAVLEDLYNLSATRSRTDKQTLAQKLLTASDEGTASDAERFVLLKKAAESAADAGDARLVQSAVDRLGESFELDVANAKERLLLRTLENVRDESAMDDFVPTSQKVVFEFVSQNRMDSALRLTEATYAACLKPLGKRHRKFVYDGQVALRKLHQSWVQSEAAREAIDRGEGTPEQHRFHGRFLCLQRGEWDQGLPHLSQSDDAAIRSAAERDLGRPTDSSLRIQVADLWYELAKGSVLNEGFAVRAAHWYELAQNDLTGLLKTKATMRLEEMRNMVRDVDQRELSAAVLARQAKP